MGDIGTGFTKVLVANRGEIAVRVIRAARDLGFATVAVFSDADAGALHVREADEAVHIGPAPASESYLSVDAVLDAAARAGADAVHPGYGFLAENARFAQACLDAGLTWIGPPPGAIRSMGDKARAKAKMDQAGVPTLPGYAGEDQSEATLAAQAAQIGFPVLVKATAGGGGRGMRVVGSPEALAEAITSARREAATAFGDDHVMLEAFLGEARHVEVQVLADAHGHVVHLGERDCTTQRRRQKVIEEAPSPAVDPTLRARIGADAVTAARAVAYEGAGTVEMLLTADGKAYFLEMNTRLQVEHPVTELVTGLDLVALQLRIAQGEPLPFTQEDVHLVGHAIEARLYAEDPSAGFTPQTGPVTWFRPVNRPGVRVDAGVAEGDTVTPFYDPMIAKVIAHAPTRAEAARKLAAALHAMPLVGVTTNRGFLIRLLRSAPFAEGALFTGTLDQWQTEGHPLLERREPTERAWALAAALLAHDEASWFRSAAPAEVMVHLRHGGEARALRVPSATLRLHEVEPGTVRYQADGVIRTVFALREPGAVWLDDGEGMVRFTEVSSYPEAVATDDPTVARSPVAGTIRALPVQEGAVVAEGDAVAVVEAMKMETRVLARQAGTLRALHVTLGVQVEAQSVVAEIEALEPGEAT